MILKASRSKKTTANTIAQKKTMTHDEHWSVRMANYLVATLLVVVPFHAFLTVWISSNVSGSYDALRLWTLAVLAVLTSIVTIWLVRQRSLRTWFGQSFLVRLAVLYAALTLVLGLIGVAFGTVSVKAFAIGLFLNLRFVLFFVLVLVVARRSNWLLDRWRLLLLVPGLAVVLFAIVQYIFLPIDFLTHFGYGPDTIPAYSTINSNKEYIRVSSTLRGPNPLGAYLILIISALAVSLRGYKVSAIVRRALYLCLAFAALLFSFSRSAWLGVVLSLIVFGVIVATSRRMRLILAAVVIGFGLVAVGAYSIAQHNRTVQNAVFHTDDDSVIAKSSNDDRLSAQVQSVDLAAENAFGLGVGSAGPASVYNDKNAPVISENYFLQLAIETGWPGLLVFLFLLASLAAFFWGARDKSLAVVLLMSLAGLTLVNLLSHAWTDETLAFTWWGLAGVAVGTGTSTATAIRRKRTAASRAR